MTAVIERRARLSIVALEGTLRAPHSAELTRRIQALLDRGERRIVVSLSDLTDIDAAGVGELVRSYNLVTAAGGVLWIGYAESHVRQLLQTAGLLGLLSEGRFGGNHGDDASGAGLGPQRSPRNR